MRKYLVLVGLFRVCLAFSYIPELTQYTEAAVNNPRVLEQANYVLTQSAKNVKLRCQDAVLVEVTKAKHKLGYRAPWTGAYYQIEMIVQTANGLNTTCKTTTWTNISISYPKGIFFYCDCTKITS
ncbi:hypothetical protein CHS0354_018106 [Potamilus streckersoni]|uniref:Uncharacterized protein n=1 Tax=Potamilus streckersoni TaxID=2493646 RepID=A0AAE0TKI3_9BIVA|nr:hypothetical protein CHS0354_018106 [Potamilus streckersoni]